MELRAATFAIFLKARSVEEKEIAGSASISALIGGVTEPAIYGVLLKYKLPFIIGMSGKWNWRSNLWNLPCDKNCADDSKRSYTAGSLCNVWTMGYRFCCNFNCGFISAGVFIWMQKFEEGELKYVRIFRIISDSE